MKGRITFEFKLSKESELRYFQKHSDKEVLDGKAQYYIEVTPESMGTLTLLSTEVLEPMRDRRSKKEKKIEKIVKRIKNEKRKKRTYTRRKRKSS